MRVYERAHVKIEHCATWKEQTQKQKGTREDTRTLPLPHTEFSGLIVEVRVRIEDERSIERSVIKE